jgi:hypothetical protein
MKKQIKKGISLIVLVITIIVIIILAGSVILSLSSNNPISQAEKAKYLSDVRTFQTELDLYKTKKFADLLGAYDPALLDANATSLKYNGVQDGVKTIYDLIPTLVSNVEYAGQFEIIDGNLVYIGSDQDKKDWAVAITVSTDITAPISPSLVQSPTGATNGNVTVTITYPSDAIVKEYSTDAATWNAYTVPVVVSTNSTMVYARAKDLANNVSTQSSITVSNIDKVVPTVTASNGGSTSSGVTVTAVASDTGGSGLLASSYQYSKDNGGTWTTATSATTYAYTGLIAGTYQCKVKVSDNATNSTTSAAVAITTAAIPAITLANSPTSWTNANTSVTITFPAVATTKLYSIDGTNWIAYTAAVAISANTTVYAKGTDAGTNVVPQVSLVVSNIDKVSPTLTAGNGGATVTSVTVTAVGAADTGGSLLNASSYQYSSDNGVTWTTATSATTYTFSGIAAGTYQCKVKVADIAGNSTISAAVAIARL